MHESLRIEGMDCPTCAIVIEHALGRLDGVLEAKVSYAAERLRLEYDSEKSSHRAVVRRIEALGYRILELEAHAGWWAEHREQVFSLVAGVLLLGGWLGGLAGAPYAVSLGLYLVAYAFGGFFTARDAAQSLLAKRFDIDTLMLIAAAGAAALGDWAEGALLLFLFSLGHALEHSAMDRARRAIEALADLAPKTALVRRDGAEVEVPVEELLRGDVVIVKPGQRLPADGKVTEGNSAVDQSPVTGESAPVDRRHLPPAIDAAGRCYSRACPHTPYAPAGPRAHQSPDCRLAGDDARARSERASGRLAPGKDRAVRVGYQRQSCRGSTARSGVASPCGC